MVAMLEEACAEGGTSLFNSGIDPGWANDVLPLTLGEMCERIDRVTIQDPRLRLDRPARVMFDLMGFDQPADQPSLISEPGALTVAWGPVVELIAAGLGITLDRVDDMTGWAAPDAYDVASGRIETGTVGAMHFRIVGHADGQEPVVIEHITRMGADAAPDWQHHPSPHGATGS